VDGEAMEQGAARAFWSRFSDWMERTPGDLQGFARREGYKSVHPSVGPAGPTLLVSRTAPQQPYRNVARDED
jgi:hypothetical protein